MVAVGATAVPSHAATLYQSLSVDLTLTFQAESTTNSKTGIITDVKDSVSLNTSKFIGILASNMGLSSVDKSATLVKATTLVPGLNITNVITNATSLVPGATFFYTNVIYTNFVYSNSVATNTPQFITNQTDQTPSGFVYLYATNLGTNLIQGQGNTVIIGTNVVYYINNGSGFDTNNLIMVNFTNDNSGANFQTSDEAWNLLNDFGGPVDAQGDYVYGNYPITNFWLAQQFTNLAGIFAGTVATNLKAAGTLYGDSLSVSVGPPRIAAGMPAPLQLTFSGDADATTTTANVGTGKSAMPFTSFNGTFDVTGTGHAGATATNSLSLYYSYYVYVSNGIVYDGSAPYGYADLQNYGTNPPAVILQGTNTQGYTNVGTNYYTNYSAINPTNQHFYISGTVKQSFLKLAP